MFERVGHHSPNVKIPPSAYCNRPADLAFSGLYAVDYCPSPLYTDGMDTLTQTLGIDPTQMQVYRALCELGRSSPSALAKQLRIPRTSAYYALDALAKNGLVAREDDGGKIIYAAKDPKALRQMIERERAALAEKERAAVELEKELRQSFRGEGYRVPKTRFYGSTKEVENLLYDETQKWHDSIAARGHVFWGFQDHSFVEQYGEWLKYHWRTRDDQLQIRLFSNESKVERRMRGKVDRRDIRPGPPQLKFGSTLWICGDYIVVLMTQRKPHYAYEIHDEVLSSTLRALFGALWEAWG